MKGFRLKNKSEISADIVKLFMSSENPIVHKIFLIMVQDDPELKEELLQTMKQP